MARWLIIIGVVVLIAGAAAWSFQDTIRFTLMTAALKPAAPFDEMPPPPAPDYSKSEHWAALPDKADGADFVVPGTSDDQSSAGVDVFFLYPTTYLNKKHWNAPLDDEAANEMVETRVLRAQASVFNGAARIYAPRYRQATFYSFLDLEGSGGKAIDLAYQDVLAAFDHYIAKWNGGRPFVLAGHSQGSRHLEQLIIDRISGAPISIQMIAAYPVGYYISVADMSKRAPDIPLCAAAGATGCYATWNAVGPNFTPWRETIGSACVNPLTWTADDALGTHAMNAGGLLLAGERLVPEVADAQCLDGTLLVTEIRERAFLKNPINLGRDNFHPLDYSLYYMSLRDNIAARTAAYLAKNAATEAPAE